MYAIERRTWILDTARRDGRIDVGETSRRLGVVPETVRRDLGELERQGQLRRVHGGAVPVEGLGFEGELSARSTVRAGEKERIGRTAARLLDGVDSIFLDEGSTVAAFADALRPRRPLTVVTAALPVATRLASRERVEVLLLGGRVRPRNLGCVDHWAVRMLEGLVVDVAVLGTNGLTARHGLTCPDPNVAAVKSAAIGTARRSVLLADHTKFGVDSFCRFGALRELHTVVTDRATGAARLRPLREAGVEVVTA